MDPGEGLLYLQLPSSLLTLHVLYKRGSKKAPWVPKYTNKNYLQMFYHNVNFFPFFSGFFPVQIYWRRVFEHTRHPNDAHGLWKNYVALIPNMRLKLHFLKRFSKSQQHCSTHTVLNKKSFPLPTHCDFYSALTKGLIQLINSVCMYFTTEMDLH